MNYCKYKRKKLKSIDAEGKFSFGYKLSLFFFFDFQHMDLWKQNEWKEDKPYL